MSGSALEMPARKKYIVTGDLRGLMRRWAEPRGFVLPGRRFFFQMEDELVADLRRIFEPRGAEVEFIRFHSIQQGLSTLIESHTRGNNLPVISLDRVYVAPDVVDDYFETTRIVKHSKHEADWRDQWRGKGRQKDGKEERVEWHGPRCGAGSILSQLDRITRLEAVRDKKRIVVVDDGIWSGASLCGVEQLFAQRKVRVEKFLVGIWTKQRPKKAKSEEAEEPETEKEEYSLIAPVFAVPAWDFEMGVVYDWVCARDFCLGAPLSGKTLGEEMTDLDPKETVLHKYYRGIPMEGNYGAPYMVPLGHVEAWANIPPEELKNFSRFCLRQALALYRAIERQTKESTKEPRAVRVSDLERPPYFYRGKRDSPVAREIEISLEILEKMNL